jgi:hypothetical protein
MTLLRKALPLALLAAAACADSSRPAMGDVNSIIVVADSALWAEVSDTVLTALQPRIFAVRDEPAFNLTHATYGSESWPDLQRFRQLLVMGEPGEPWMERPLTIADTTVDPPAIVEVQRVWARQQLVTALVLPSEGAPEAVRSRLDSLASLLESRYRQWARTRMYISGHDSALVDTLRSVGRFTIDIPEVYRWRRQNDSTFFFLNDNPDASQLVRWLTVSWYPLPDGPPEPDQVLDRRDSLAAAFYDWDQRARRDRLEITRLDEPAGGGIEIRGAWAGTDEGYPYGGAFITRAIDCPAQDRRYLLDAWLYAPARDKYQYVIQLETLLGSFGCGSA